MPMPQSQSGGFGMTLLLGLSAALLVLLIMIYPEPSFHASLAGLTVWWKYVFPGLLPFLIVSELLLGLGAVHGLGVLLQPVMRLLFRLPGSAGVALAVGLTAGFPAGAGITAALRKQEKLTRGEAERLLSAVHFANPVLMATVIGAGFLHHVETGLFIAAIHYGSGLAAGWLAVIGRKPPSGTDGRIGNEARSLHEGSLLRLSLSDMREARRTDGRVFGKLLGDSVSHSIQTLFTVGGLIIFFAVLSGLLSAVLDSSVPRAVKSLLPALLEPHLGAYALGQSAGATAWGAACIAAILGWGGLSVHAQVKSLIYGTDIRYGPFLRARLLHAALSFPFAFLLWKAVAAAHLAILPVIAAAAASARADVSAASIGPGPGLGLTDVAFLLLVSFPGLVASLLCISLFIKLCRRVLNKS